MVEGQTGRRYLELDMAVKITVCAFKFWELQKFIERHLKVSLHIYRLCIPDMLRQLVFLQDTYQC